MTQQNGMIPRDEIIEEPPPLPPAQGKTPKIGLGSENVKIVLISFAVTFVILALMSFAGGIAFVTKKDFDDNWEEFSATMSQAQASLVQTKASVDDAVQNMQSTISAQVSNYVAQSIGGLSTQVQQINSAVSQLSSAISDPNTGLAALNAKIVALTSKVAELETKIAELEAEKAQGEEASDDIGLDLRDYTEDLILVIDAGAEESPTSWSFSGEIARITITNNTGKALEDVRLALEIFPYPSLPSGYTASLSGWSPTSLSSTLMRFKSARFKMDVGSSKRLYLVLDINGEGYVGSKKTIRFSEVYAEIEDYFIIK